MRSSKALEVLDAVRQSEELGLAEIRDRVGLNKSRLFRLPCTLGVCRNNPLNFLLR
jgi:DNA-binding IclR family transcriptional regulator